MEFELREREGGGILGGNNEIKFKMGVREVGVGLNITRGGMWGAGGSD